MGILDFLFRSGSSWTPAEVRAFLEAEPAGSYYLVDVREPAEQAGGCLPGAMRMPLGTVGQAAAGLDRDKPVIVYCAHGMRSLTAARVLKQLGFTAVHSMSGGIVAWQGEGGQVV